MGRKEGDEVRAFMGWTSEKMMDALAKYTQAFQRLHCDKPGGRPRPHKAVMLLAVSVLAEADELQEAAA